MTIHKLFLPCIAGLMMLAACKKDDAEDVRNTPPLISIKSISRDSVTQFQDSVIIELRYDDAQGNIGNSNPDVNDLEVKDSRLSNPDYYHVQPLAPDGYTLNISGTLRIKLNTLFLLGIGNAETATFTVRLRDSSGDWSDPVESDPVVIVRE